MNITSIPAPRVNFIDERTGLMSREWYRFFLNLFVITGSGTSDASTVDLQIEPITQDMEGTLAEASQHSQLAAMAAKYDQALDAIGMQPVSVQGVIQDDVGPSNQSVQIESIGLEPVNQLGTLASQNADLVSITGGTITATVTTPGADTFLNTAAALTDGAGVGAGTITTAPAAGNPTKWIGINDAGVTRYIPAW